MTAAQGVLSYILDKPDDLVARLAFADALDEDADDPGDEHWAHLIRTQIAISRAKDEGGEELDDLHSREKLLLEKSGPRIARGLFGPELDLVTTRVQKDSQILATYKCGDYQPTVSLGITNGLVGKVNMDLALWINRAKHLTKLQPVRHVAVPDSRSGLTYEDYEDGTGTAYFAVGGRVEGFTRRRDCEWDVFVSEVMWLFANRIRMEWPDISFALPLECPDISFALSSPFPPHWGSTSMSPGGGGLRDAVFFALIQQEAIPLGYSLANSEAEIDMRDTRIIHHLCSPQTPFSASDLSELKHSRLSISAITMARREVSLRGVPFYVFFGLCERCRYAVVTRPRLASHPGRWGEPLRRTLSPGDGIDPSPPRE